MKHNTKLTKRAIDALPSHDRSSPSSEAEYSFTECPGLKLCITKNGRKYFRFRYVFAGRKQVMTLGDYGVIDVETARKKVMDAKRQLLEGHDPHQKKVEPPPEITFLAFSKDDYPRCQDSCRLGRRAEF